MPPPEEPPGAVTSPPDHLDSFDPGGETGYLRREPREEREAEERALAEARQREEAHTVRPVRPIPARRPQPQAHPTVRPIPPTPPGLRGPTAKVATALAAASAGALLLGSLLGLPSPLAGSEGGVNSFRASQSAALGLGTAAALYRGPFHPVRGKYDYGEAGAEFGADRGGRRHEGQDIFSKSGTPLIAVRDGIVVDGAPEKGRYAGGRGNYIVIYNPIEDRSFVYMHLLKPASAEKGERVRAGQVIGLMGCTGSCDGTHLHFEVRRGKASFAAKTKALDPLPYVEDLPQAPEELAAG